MEIRVDQSGCGIDGKCRQVFEYIYANNTGF